MRGAQEPSSAPAVGKSSWQTVPSPGFPRLSYCLVDGSRAPSALQGTGAWLSSGGPSRLLDAVQTGRGAWGASASSLVRWVSRLCAAASGAPTVSQTEGAAGRADLPEDAEQRVYGAGREGRMWDFLNDRPGGRLPGARPSQTSLWVPEHGSGGPSSPADHPARPCPPHTAAFQISAGQPAREGAA